MFSGTPWIPPQALSSLRMWAAAVLEETDLSDSWNCYLLFRQSKRIHIVSHNGFPAATVSIPLLRQKGDKEEVTELKATTYDLENGKVVATELDKASIFMEEAFRKMRVIEKFTFPAVREGLSWNTVMSSNRRL